MLAGIYYGAQYGGSTTAILVNIPGEATSVVTTLDGHQMAKQGRAGVALGVASIGSFINKSPAEVFMAAAFGMVGYFLVKFGFEPAPLLLGFVLGKLMEEKLRQALVISRGSFMVFVNRPLSAGMLALSLVLMVFAILPAIRSGREEVFREAE